MTNENQTGDDKLLAAGVFKGRPIEGVLTKSGKGKDQYAARFQLLEGADAGKHITWWGGFEGGGFGYTTGALVAMGWDKKTPLRAWKPSKDVSLVLEHHVIPAVPGKPARKVTRVKYINALDGSGGGVSLASRAMSEADAQAASDAIMARLAAGEGAGPTPGEVGGANGTPVGFDAGPPTGEEDDSLPF